MTDTPSWTHTTAGTVEKLFTHPTSHNIQWHDVLSLLQAAGEAEEDPDGRPGHPRRRDPDVRPPPRARPRHPAGRRPPADAEGAGIEPS